MSLDHARVSGRERAVVLVAAVALLIGVAIGRRSPPNAAAIADNPLDQLTGDSFRLERAYRVSVHVPNAEVDPVLAAVTDAVGLPYGKYDRVAFIDAPGLEQFRPTGGAKGGAYPEAGRVPTTNVSFSIARDAPLLRRALDAIRRVHSYEEPVITVDETWRSRDTGGDGQNPNRWWNRRK